MKIVSRPEDQVAGEGPYSMRLSFEELELLAALLYVIRIGDDVYQHAALQLLTTVEELSDGDQNFLEDSANIVNMQFSVIDDDDDIIEQHSYENICIEI